MIKHFNQVPFAMLLRELRYKIKYRNDSTLTEMCHTMVIHAMIVCTIWHPEMCFPSFWNGHGIWIPPQIHFFLCSTVQPLITSIQTWTDRCCKSNLYHKSACPDIHSPLSCQWQFVGKLPSLCRGQMRVILVEVDTVSWSSEWHKISHHAIQEIWCNKSYENCMQSTAV